MFTEVMKNMRKNTTEPKKEKSRTVGSMLHNFVYTDTQTHTTCD